MVVLWSNGKKLGTVDGGELLTRLEVATERVQLKDESGSVLGEYAPAGPPIPWEPDTTMADIQKRMVEPGLTYEEVKQRLGRA